MSHPRCITRYSGIFIVKKELLQCLTRKKSVFCMFSRANIRKNALLQMSCIPFSGLSAGICKPYTPWSKDNVALICNDSGKVDGLPLNRCIEDYDVIAGNFFICGFSGEEFCSLTDKQFRYYEKLFRDPELFLPTPIGIMPMKCTPDQYKRLMQERSAANRGER